MRNNKKKILLNEYKNFDFLNTKNNIIKILVSYIKPFFLFKSEILEPIQLGVAVEKALSKDGIPLPEDIDWLHQNCISDDFNCGISQYNRRVGFLTGTFWAWKNYNKLGAPKYFGSFGYRRILNPEFLHNLENYDVILPNRVDFKFKSIKSQMQLFHGEKLVKMMMSGFEKIYPNELEDLNNYLNGSCGYFWELYIFKKEIFFNFCEWIFPLVFEYLKYEQIVLADNDFRDIGFIMERLTGYYCYNKLFKNPSLKVKECPMELTENVIVNHKFINKDLFAKLRNCAKNNQI